ncbi:hypothetical protein BT96DRAFT_1003061 [Gymnopus androsaceus JB14]|uniref:Fungal-type protein kinase domain-containing protein n=1 Tax=Gymnopus androsaceus JB14 TaxID=1447944 RepID=A0A6A4GWE1_9AGAR|nr:hypothetical protein BT96DRAFT_1003061 [Gymnopus androsaceus JB14]
MPSLIPLDCSLGALFIGVILSTAVYGVTCLQVHNYFMHHSFNDRWFLKLFASRKKDRQGTTRQMAGYARDLLSNGNGIMLACVDDMKARFTLYDHSIIVQTEDLDLENKAHHLKFYKKSSSLEYAKKNMPAHPMPNEHEPPSSGILEGCLYTFTDDEQQTRTVKSGKVLFRPNGIIGASSFSVAFAENSPQAKLAEYFPGYGKRVMRGSIQQELRPLRELKSANQFAQVIYDVLQIHEWVYCSAGVLHHDISHGNIMFRQEGDEIYGVMTDFDLGSDQAPITPHPFWDLVW